MDVFLNKLENVIEKFYKSQSNIEVLKSEINKKDKEFQELFSKIKNLEIDIEMLKRKNNSTESMLSSSVDFIVKIIYMLVVAYILYLVGWEGSLEISP
jgi:septal ring factor EnvC (AmiA/AmiB activator)